MAEELVLYSIAEVNMKIRKGDTLGPVGFSLNWNGFDWTGTVLSCEIKKIQTGNPLITVDLNTGLVITTTTTTNDTITFTFEVDKAQTKTLAAGIYFYDIQFTMPDSRDRTLYEGKITVIQDTTESI